MSENIIGLKTVGELLGKNFFVPSYQRGYRWTEQEVKDLLDDIYEFKKGENGGEFYCLQPLVVKSRGKDEYEVIDGQQRLTTIFIILKFLGESQKYSLIYETREGSKIFLESLGSKSESIHVGEKEIKPEDNIDFFHMSWAYKTIKYWFNHDFVPTPELPDKERFLLRLLNNVKFIWYETDDPDPIKVFTRLNIGKIPLTNAELIKALFLNSSNFGEESDKHLRLRQQEIASEWDQIEYTLQNEEFWLFIHNKGYNNPTRIDFIFDIICERESGSVNTDGIDSYRTFRHFYKSFKNAKKARKCIEDAKNDEKEAIEEAKKLIEDVKGKGKIDWKKTEVKKEIEKCDTIYRWKEVKKIFQTFSEWFNDLKLYHYVGYLVDGGEGEIGELLDIWDEQDNKKQFLIKLKKMIWKKVMGEIEEDRQEDMIAEKLDKTYETIADCRPLLLLHNIQTVIDQCKNSTESYGMQVFHKFPFHIYKNENWDVEHIDSNTPNDLNKLKDRRGWLIAIRDTINRNTEIEKAKKENLIEEIERFMDAEIEKAKKENLIEEIKSLRNTEIEKAKKENLIEEIERFRNAEIKKKEDLIEEIKKIYKDPGKDEFEDLKREIEENFLKGEETFSNPEEKNKIWNFALLDSSTNRDRGYGNSIFSAKRRYIIGKDKGKEIVLPDEWDGELKEKDAKSSFIPPCTKYVFLKYYSPASSDPNYWTLSDAKAYKKDISKTLEKLFKPESKQDE